MKKKTQKVLLTLFTVLVALAAVIIVSVLHKPEEDNGIPKDTVDKNGTFNTDTPATVNGIKDININLGNGMYITNVGGYTGIYMEDGSDELVTGVTMIIVENTGKDDIQYAEILLPIGKEEAKFVLSTLPAGEKVVLLEKERMGYSGESDCGSAIAQNVVIFDKPLDKMEDQFEIQLLGGMMNVRNISGSDIRGNIVIYYKNSAADILYGGITYRLTIEGGLAAGEVRQMPGSHISEKGSEVMFITVG